MITLRPATSDDCALLRGWEKQPHVIESGATNDDWMWETELLVKHEWREQLIAQLDGRPIGYLEIIDPSLESSHYWGDIGPGHRALDIWIGEPDCIGRGHGTTMMRLAINRCFANDEVHTILVDPLASHMRAHRFYEKLGFRKTDRRYFGDDDCCVYALRRADWAS
ncbi:MAG: acetyltransferase [Candidatus Sumerlaeia bacterium]|nr:acetyltransferase [Candidatus Sumerlaeia bacterium]